MEKLFDSSLLSLVEVYEYYDRPILYSSKSGDGQHYVFIWADDDEVLRKEIWLCAPISDERFVEFRSGKLEIRDVFLNAPEGYIYMIDYSYLDQKQKVKKIECNKIDNDLLPVADNYINPYEIFDINNKRIYDIVKRRD